MRRIAIIAVVAVLLVGVQPAVADGTVETVTILGGEVKKVDVEIGNASVQALQVTGPITVKGRRTEDGVLTLTVQAGKPNVVQDAKIYISLRGAGEVTVAFDVVPYYRYKKSSEVTSGTRQAAQKWHRFKDNWINTRVDRKQTGQGMLVVYEQRLPHRGKLGPNGMPTGEWVQVPYNATAQQPNWFFTTPSGAMAYMAKRAHRNGVFRRNSILIGAAIGTIPFIINFVALPYWRRRRDREIWAGLGGNNDR